MTSLPKEKTVAKKTITPLDVDNVTIGMKLDDADHAVLRAFEFIKPFLKAKKVSCLYVVPEVNPVFPLRAIYPETPTRLDDELEEQLMEKMETMVKRNIGSGVLDQLDLSIKSGPPLDTLASFAQESGSDLVCIGKRALEEERVISAMNVVRMVDANVLVAPQHSKPGLSTIMVPVDFSDHSVRALQTALGFKHASIDPVRIIALHIHQVAPLYYHEPGFVPVHQLSEFNQDFEGQLDQFLAEKLPGFEDEVEPVLVETNKPEVATQLLAGARKASADLIIMGSKGHSKLKQIFLGSTTELLLRKNDTIPVLVVK